MGKVGTSCTPWTRHLVETWGFVIAAVLAACSSDSDEGTSSEALTQAAEYEAATFIAASSSNYAKGRPEKIKYVVIHDAEGSAKATVTVFKNPSRQASSHYVVAKDGSVVQMVREADTAWHGGSRYFNAASIGIEHDGFADNYEFPEDEYEGSAKLVAYLVTKYDIPIDREHIIGHYQVPPVGTVKTPCPENATDCGGKQRHYDPGRAGGNWKWAEYMDRVARLANASIDRTRDGGGGGAGGPGGNGPGDGGARPPSERDEADLAVGRIEDDDFSHPSPELPQSQ